MSGYGRGLLAADAMRPSKVDGGWSGNWYGCQEVYLQKILCPLERRVQKSPHKNLEGDGPFLSSVGDGKEDYTRCFHHCQGCIQGQGGVGGGGINRFAINTRNEAELIIVHLLPLFPVPVVVVIGVAVYVVDKASDKTAVDA